MKIWFLWRSLSGGGAAVSFGKNYPFFPFVRDRQSGGGMENSASPAGGAAKFCAPFLPIPSMPVSHPSGRDFAMAAGSARGPSGRGGMKEMAPPASWGLRARQKKTPGGASQLFSRANRIKLQTAAGKIFAAHRTGAACQKRARLKLSGFRAALRRLHHCAAGHRAGLLHARFAAGHARAFAGHSAAAAGHSRFATGHACTLAGQPWAFATGHAVWAWHACA